jgi:predicted small metal-binding protein
MPRKMFDCRDLPGDCTLAITGEEDEVVEAQVLHAVQAHGQADSTELREQIRAALKEAPPGAY